MSEDTTKNDDTTVNDDLQEVDDDLQETDGYIEVVMPDGSRTTSTLLKLHVKAIEACAEQSKFDYPSDAALFLIEKGDSAEGYARRMQAVALLSAGVFPAINR